LAVQATLDQRLAGGLIPPYAVDAREAQRHVGLMPPHITCAGFALTT
jgi:hypothetical protein